MSDAQINRELDRIRKLPWSAHFHKTVDNPTVRGGKVDMYLLIDDDSGEGIVTVGVPHGQHWVAEYIAGCCADPYFVRVREEGDTSVQIALHRALMPFVSKGDMIDAREVHAAATVLIEAYVAQMPKRSRSELIDATMKQLVRLRAAD